MAARSNCLFFALALCWRRRRFGLTWRWSHYGPFWHFLYQYRTPAGRTRKVSYVPTAPRKRLIPPPLFHGRAKWGD